MHRQRKIAIAGVTGAMLIGAGTGVVLNLPSGAGAGSNATLTTTATSDSGADSTTVTSDGTATAPADAPPGGPGEILKSALDKLVTDGTITQAQEDAIITGLEAVRPEIGPGPRISGPGMDHGGWAHGGIDHGPGFSRRGAHLDAAATALGITADELRTELQAGKTIADVATEKGVDVQTVIDAIVAAETANITERVTNEVNGVRPDKPGDSSTSDSSTSDSSTTTPTTGG